MNELSVVSQAEERTKMFELAQREAKLFSVSTMVPKEYQGNIANCMIALEIAHRIGASPIMVMQNLYIVHGKPSWSASFLIACCNQCGRFSPMDFEFSGEGDNYGCEAVATVLETGKVLRSDKITWKMVKAEGWDSKSGSKWKTMPGQMFRYRAATFFTRAYAPEISLGFRTADENEDIVDAESVRTVSGHQVTKRIQKVADPFEAFDKELLSDDEKAAIQREEAKL
jgi:hypothetical protein